MSRHTLYKTAARIELSKKHCYSKVCKSRALLVALDVRLLPYSFRLGEKSGRESVARHISSLRFQSLSSTQPRCSDIRLTALRVQEMADSDMNIGSLSESQQVALGTYTSVTNQEPSQAIPLLQRSEWNVQVRHWEQARKLDQISNAYTSSDCYCQIL